MGSHIQDLSIGCNIAVITSLKLLGELLQEACVFGTVLLMHDADP
jgi:hypothetical protein